MTPKKEIRYPGYIALRLEEDLRRKLEELAAAGDRSIGYIARVLLREALAARESKKGRKKMKSSKVGGGGE